MKTAITASIIGVSIIISSFVISKALKLNCQLSTDRFSLFTATQGFITPNGNSKEEVVFLLDKQTGKVQYLLAIGIAKDGVLKGNWFPLN